MPTIVIETLIAASPETCFDLMRDPRLHEQVDAERGGASAALPADDKIEPGCRATFESRWFIFRLQTTVEVAEAERPHEFTDQMISGLFETFRHRHEFIGRAGGTLLRDTLEFTLPLGIIGRVIGTVVVKRRLQRLVAGRNEQLKQLAEAKR